MKGTTGIVSIIIGLFIAVLIGTAVMPTISDSVETNTNTTTTQNITFTLNDTYYSLDRSAMPGTVRLYAFSNISSPLNTGLYKASQTQVKIYSNSTYGCNNAYTYTGNVTAGCYYFVKYDNSGYVGSIGTSLLNLILPFMAILIILGIAAYFTIK